MAWRPPTMADRDGDDGFVVCEGTEDRPCGRTVRKHVMLHVQSRWVCDACKETLVRSGAMTRAELVQELGAPTHVIQRFEES